MRLFIFLAMTCVTPALSTNTSRVYAQTVDDLYQASLPELKPNTITVPVTLKYNRYVPGR